MQYDAYMIQSKMNDWAFLGCVEGPMAGKKAAIKHVRLHAREKTMYPWSLKEFGRYRQSEAMRFYF